MVEEHSMLEQVSQKQNTSVSGFSVVVIKGVKIGGRMFGMIGVVVVGSSGSVGSSCSVGVVILVTIST